MTLEELTDQIAPMLKDRPEKISVFLEKEREHFALYDLEISIHHRLMGGVPMNPKIIEGWLRTNIGIPDAEEFRHVVMRTMREMGVDAPEDASYEDLKKAMEATAGELKTNGFKRDEDGLWIPGYYVKACVKEAAAIAFKDERLGRYRSSRSGELVGGKRPDSYVAERVFVKPYKLHLGVMEPAPIPEIKITHTEDWRGERRSSLTYVQYVDEPVVSCQVWVLRTNGGQDEALSTEEWERIWITAQENGLGANRSQGEGTFAVTRWQKIR